MSEANAGGSAFTSVEVEFAGVRHSELGVIRKLSTAFFEGLLK